MSERGKAWLHFGADVMMHVEEYVVPQYGDKGQDQVTNYTAEDCVKQAQKYLARFNRNSREGQQELDFKKAAHYIQLANEKYLEEKENANVAG